MIRKLTIGWVGGLGLMLLQCTGPQASGSKTNWFVECDRDADCGTALSCACGICTVSCGGDAECDEGRCSSSLESSLQCEGEETGRVCFPESDASCFEAPIQADADLGEALVPVCSVDGALACEAFDQPLSPEHSTWYEGDMTASVQDCDVRAGAAALHYQSSAPGQAQTRLRLVSEIGSGPLHARFFVKLGAAMALPEQLQLLEFWDREGSTVPERVSVFVNKDGVPRVYVGASGTTLEPSEPTPLPRDTWLCIEFQLDVQPENGAAELRIDGTLVLSGSGFASRPENPIRVAVIEAQPTADTTGVDVYVDELVVATTAIGCN
jgi:hypothetical protein